MSMTSSRVETENHRFVLRTDGRVRRVVLILGLFCASAGVTAQELAKLTDGFVNVDGTRLYYEFAGDGPAVVLIHGANLDRRMWDLQMEVLSSSYRVIRYDIRTFGRSGQQTEGFSHVDDLRRLLDHLQVKRAHLVGLSLGGRIALDFALEHPQRVVRMVLAGPGLTGYEWSRDPAINAMQSAAEAGHPEHAVELWLKHAYMLPAMEQPELARRLRSIAMQNAPAWSAPSARERLPDPPTIHRLAAIRTPTLLLLGQRDVADIHKIAARLESGIPNVKRKTITGAGHVLNMEAPNEFNRAVLDFLKESPPLKESPGRLSGTVPARVPLAHLQPCNDRSDALCTEIPVAEDPASRDGRTINLKVVVLTSRSKNPREPVFALSGGPGGSATQLAHLILGGQVNRVLENRDVVLVDQRGTGGSNPLPCTLAHEPHGYFGRLFDSDAVAACRSELSKKADLRFYTTSIAMNDLDTVRAALGYDRIVILAVSYGTRAAMEYMRRHGEHVTAAILDGVDAFSSWSPLYFAYDAQEALERVFTDCASDEACARAYPDLRKSFRTVLDRFRNGSRTVAIRPSKNAEPIEVSYSLQDFGYAIRGMLYNEGQIAQMPRLLTAAAERGEIAPFAQAYYDRNSSLMSALKMGLYLSVICSEDVPFFNSADVERWTAGTFLGSSLIDDYQDACSLWPRGEIPRGFHEPLSSTIPTLVLSGGRDPVTAPRWGEMVVRHLPHSLHVLFSRGGHAVSRNPCGASIVLAFLQHYSFEDVDTSCASQLDSSIQFKLPGH